MVDGWRMEVRNQSGLPGPKTQPDACLALRMTLFAFLHVRLEGFSACRDSQVSTSVEPLPEWGE